jgi:hypothetical protein
MAYLTHLLSLKSNPSKNKLKVARKKTPAAIFSRAARKVKKND